MRLTCISDIHLDCYRPSDNVKLLKDIGSSLDLGEVALIAGDLCEFGNQQSLNMAKEFMEQFCQNFNKVILINGNHDHWGTSISDIPTITNDTFGHIDNFVYLNNSSVVIDDVMFYGGTLWFEDDDEWGNPYWIDYRQMRTDTAKSVRRSSKAFKKGLKALDRHKGPKVVLSHHMPLVECVAPEWMGFGTNKYFLNDCSKEIKEYSPNLWLLGHTHNPFDFQYEKSRIFCNPRCYDGENTNPQFIERMNTTL